jgi:seryl-tRNA synthetase
MFDILEVQLDEPLQKNEIGIFQNLFLKEVKAHKLIVDPVNRQSLTIFYIGQPEPELRHMVQTFLAKWQSRQKRYNSVEKTDLQTGEDFDRSRLHRLRSLCEPRNSEDISDQLIEQEWVYLLRGQEISFNQIMIRLLNVFDQSFINYFNNRLRESEQPYEFEERQYSAFIPRYYLEKMHYFENAPAHLFFVSHLQHDGTKIGQFSKDAKVLGGRIPDHVQEYLEKPEHVLQSAPCFKVYFELENKLLSANKIFCLRGLSFRNESKNTFLLERLLNFSMREYVFVGSPEFVLQFCDLSLEWSIQWMQQMGIKGHCQPANDPFFISDELRDQFDIPRQIKYEVRADIPYKQDSLSIASFDIHGNFFSELFNIRKQDGGKVWSGCIGLGLERSVWCFLQQYGLDQRNWPEVILRCL